MNIFSLIVGVVIPIAAILILLLILWYSVRSIKIYKNLYEIEVKKNIGHKKIRNENENHSGISEAK